MLVFTRFSLWVIVVGLCAEFAVAGPFVDCNDNGIADDVDIADGTSLDVNLDGVPDECDLGACCFEVEPSCERINQVECDELGGTWFRGMSCPGFGINSICDRGTCCRRSAPSGTACAVVASYECWGDDWVFATFLTCLQLDCDAAAFIRLRAVAVNDEPVVPAPKITVHPGDSVEVEVFVSGWGPSIGALNTWQIAIARDIAEHSGDSGSLLQRGVDTSSKVCAKSGAACTDFVDCFRCTGGSNEGAVCDADSDCGGGICTDFEEGACVNVDYGGWFIATDVCDPPSTRAGAPCRLDAECPGGSCVPRSDFVFASVDPRICATSPGLGERDFRAGCTTIFSSPVPDDGREYYAVTGIFDVTDDAHGLFTIVADHYPASFLSSILGDDAPFSVDPLLVTVVPPPPTGACCDCSRAGSPILPEPVCTNGATLAECQGIGQTWTEDATCAEITCECPFEAIPATSEWGLLVLALTLLIGIKVIFHARARPLSA